MNHIHNSTVGVTHLKGSDGLILGKSSAMRVSIPSTYPHGPSFHFFVSFVLGALPPLLAPSLVLFSPLSA
jgi:hypothetical protein